jgi:hypothetical protein
MRSRMRSRSALATAERMVKTNWLMPLSVTSPPTQPPARPVYLARRRGDRAKDVLLHDFPRLAAAGHLHVTRATARSWGLAQRRRVALNHDDAPLDPHSRKMARPGGFEPPTHSLEVRSGHPCPQRVSSAIPMNSRNTANFFGNPQIVVAGD